MSEIEKYRIAAETHGYNTEIGNSENANRAYRRLALVFKNLCKTSEDCRLFDLLRDENLWVRVWAATHCLEINEREAIAVLQSILDMKQPIISMTAKFTLEEWSKGNLKFR